MVGDVERDDAVGVGGRAPHLGGHRHPRPAGATSLGCLASVLACEHDSFEVIVVDQSDPASPVPHDRRVVHLPTDTRGKSAALNLGMAAAARRSRRVHRRRLHRPARLARPGRGRCSPATRTWQWPSASSAPSPTTRARCSCPRPRSTSFEIVRDTRRATSAAAAGANMAARRMHVRRDRPVRRADRSRKPVPCLRGVRHLLPRPRQRAGRGVRARAHGHALGRAILRRRLGADAEASVRVRGGRGDRQAPPDGRPPHGGRGGADHGARTCGSSRTASRHRHRTGLGQVAYKWRGWPRASSHRSTGGRSSSARRIRRQRRLASRGPGLRRATSWHRPAARRPPRNPAMNPVIRARPRGRLKWSRSAIGGHNACENSQSGSTTARSSSGANRFGARGADPDVVTPRVVTSLLQRAKAVMHDTPVAGGVHVPAAQQHADRHVHVVGRHEPCAGPEELVEPAELEHDVATHGHAGAHAPRPAGAP